MSIDPKQIQEKPRALTNSAVDPSPVAGKGTIYTKIINGETEAFYMDSVGNSVQLTTSGSVNLPAIPSLVPVGGLTDSVLTKSSASDYATSWKKVNQIINEFYFVLPAAVDLLARLTAIGSITGLALNTAQNDPQQEPEFGSSTKTLIIKPVGGSDLVLIDVKVKALIGTGLAVDQGWNNVSNIGTYKSDTSKTKGALINFQDFIDPSQDVLVYAKFVKSLSLQA